MSRLSPIRIDLTVAETDLVAFRKLLDSSKELSEATDILPFFQAHPNLSALIGRAGVAGLNPDRLKHELVLFGDYRCDLVVGDSKTQTYCFVEFEDAKRGSVFRTRKSSWQYSPRFEKGFSQLVDWVYLVEDLRHTHRFEVEFGSDVASYACLLVIGRDHDLTLPLLKRLRWRADQTLIASKKFYFTTFDQLYDSIEHFLSWSKAIQLSTSSSGT